MSGASTGVHPEDQNLIVVFVFPTDPSSGGWFAQRPPAALEQGGAWSQEPSYLGAAGFLVSTGDTVRIQAALVLPEADFNGTRLDELAAGVVIPNLQEIKGIVAFSNFVDVTVER